MGLFEGEVLWPGLGRGGGSRSVGIFVGRGNWVGVWVQGSSLGWGCFRGMGYLGRGSGLGGVGRSFGVGLWVGLGGVVGCGLGVVDPGFFSLVLKLLSCSPLFFLPSASTFPGRQRGF